MAYIGAHTSTAKGYQAAVEETIRMGGNTFQFFSRNPRGSRIKAYDEKDVSGFQRLRKEHGFGPICAHAPYTMNLAGTDPKVYDFARMVLKEDIKRMDQMEIELMCIHPGSHVGSGSKEGIKRISEAFNEVLTGKEKITLMLETMSGKGTEVGYRFEELKEMIERIEHKEKIGICFDFCHVFSSGYDIVNGLEKVLKEFDEVVSLSRLKAIHVNDSMMPFGGRKDRHKPLGEGEIGMKAILNLISHPAFAQLPMLLETPLEAEGHRREIALLKKHLETSLTNK